MDWLKQEMQKKPVDLRWKLYPCNNVKALEVNFSSTLPLNNVHQNWNMKVDKINNIIKSMENEKVDNGWKNLKMLHLSSFLDFLKWSWIKESQTKTRRTGRTFHSLKYKRLNLV